MGKLAARKKRGKGFHAPQNPEKIRKLEAERAAAVERNRIKTIKAKEEAKRLEGLRARGVGGLGVVKPKPKKRR